MINFKNLTEKLEKFFEKKFIPIIITSSVILATLVVFEYILLRFGDSLINNPEIKYVGAPPEFPIIYVILCIIMSIILAILIVLFGNKIEQK